MHKTIKNLLDLTTANWKDVKETDYDVVILPWGAIEPHNYHLPYATDCYLSFHVALDSAVAAYEKSGTLSAVLPPVFLGSQNPGQWTLPLCIHTSSETQKAILNDIVNSLYIQGFRKLVVVNGHGGNNFKPYIRDLAFKYPDFIIVALNWYEIVPTDNYFEEKPDEHGGEQETSALMYFRPDLVQLEQAGDGVVKPVSIEALNRKIGWAPRNWQEVSTDTGIGNPHRSTAEKGEKYISEVVDKISDLLADLRNFNPTDK